MSRRLLLAVLAGATVVALLVAVFPTRTWLTQRDALAAERARAAVLARENDRLANRLQELGTDAEVERLAREQYNMVRPGEEAYAILPAPAPASPEAEAAPAPPDDRAPATAPIANVRTDDDRPAWRKLLDALAFWD